jgi:hypothetical protein
VVRIIKIVESIEADGSEKKLGGVSQQNGLSHIMPLGKECKRFGPLYHKKQAKGTISNKGATQRGKPSNIGNKEVALWCQGKSCLDNGRNVKK